MSVLAAVRDWQDAAFPLGSDEYAEITAVGKWGVIDPPKRGLSGPQGYGTKAGGDFKLKGASEGCLLVKTGNGSLLPFTKDSEVIKVAVPGPLAFIANDAHPAQNGKGYDDNTGSLSVTIRIFKK